MKCPTCEGSGKISPGGTDSKCLNCDGRGVVQVPIKRFVNCRICRGGKLLSDHTLAALEDTGLFVDPELHTNAQIVDLENAIIAPGFLELQMNGRWGFHFTNFKSPEQCRSELCNLADRLVETGVTGFYATLPTVHQDLYPHILPLLCPSAFPKSASLLGAHVEGPYLDPSKAGAHNPEWFKIPSLVSPSNLYGDVNLSTSIKLVTVAPELEGSTELIRYLSHNQGHRVSLGHSSANYNTGKDALKHGATALTHVFNAMRPLHHREPGLAGLISDTQLIPYYSLIADNVHLHPSVLSAAFRANPSLAILITDSLEVGGLSDGIHPGNLQISHLQSKIGDKVVIAGTDTLIGGCAGLDVCVRNLIRASGCSVAEAVRCVTENIADMMGLQDRGSLEQGKRADFVVLDEQGNVLQTWIGGKKAWPISH